MGETATPSDSRDIFDMKIEDLMNIEVTSVSKKRERLAEAPSAVTVITQEDIRRSGLQQIPEMLRLAPGIFVQRTASSGGWAVASRGFANPFNPELLVLQDGRTLYTPLFSGAFWSTVDYVTQDIDRIEVIRGPGATLWGANAVNGVININSKSAADTQGWLLSGLGGTDESNATVRYGGKIDDQTYYRVYGKGRAIGDLTSPTGDLGDEWQDGRGGFRLDRQCDASNLLTVQGDVFNQSLTDGIGGISSLAPPFAASPGTERASGFNLLGRWTHAPSTKSELSVQTYFDQFNWRDAFIDYQINTFDIDFQHRFELARNHEITYGAGMRLQWDDGNPSILPPMLDPQTQSMYIFSAFVQDGITLVPERLKAFVGSKFEVNSFTGFEYQPSARLMWTLNEQNSIWAAVSRAVRTPNRMEHDATMLFAAFPTPTGLTTIEGFGSKSVQSEEMMAYELGYRCQPTKRLTLDITGFANNYDNLLVTRQGTPFFDPNPVPRMRIPSVFFNGASAQSYGGELAANWRPTDNWRLSASYSSFFLFAHANRQALPDTESHLEDTAPVNMFQIHSYLDITRNLELNAGLYYVDAIDSGPVADYLRVDLGITWRLAKGMELSAGIQNLFDPSHPEAAGGAFRGDAEVQRAGYVQFVWRP